MQAEVIRRSGTGFAWVLLALLTAWAYWPGLDGPNLLDDFVNLRPLERLQQDEGFASDIVGGNRSGLLGRPVSMGSFTLERLYLDDGTRGQKRLGLLLHLLNGTLVLLLARALLHAASQPRAEWCALLIAGLWLTLPLLLSTTLYVVQRMTLLSAFFTLLALLCYCRGRERLDRRAWPWFALSGLAVMLATLSKENGLLAVPMIVALEVFVFGLRDRRGQVHRGLLWTHGALVIAPLAAMLVLAIIAPERLVGSYDLRPFTLGERLLTQGRVLLDYVAQILWVDVHRLGVYQDDFPLSRGLFDPPSTAAALGFWLLAIAGIIACAVAQRFRLLAFGLAFFLVGHAMESTVIPLEIYFEHRNYLPAFGILFGLVAAANQLQARWAPLRGWVTLALLLVIGRNLQLLGSQSIIWSDNHLLHMEAVNYHPRSERALLALGQVYAVDGNVGTALELVDRANQVRGRDGAAADVLEALFYCLAAKPLTDQVLSAQGITESDIADPHMGDHVYYMARLVMRGRCPRENGVVFADTMNRWLGGEGELRGNREILGSLLLLENELERYDRAMRYAEALTRKEPGNVMGLQFTLYLAHVLELPEAAEAAKRKLVELRDRGELSRQQVYNLELFLN